ncbi:MAG: rhodanese-like domain-containing protein [Bacteroidetes bacterium]|nr:rhodanese-like domain-containing protein [Bacteroidota bacterium]
MKKFRYVLIFITLHISGCLVEPPLNNEGISENSNANDFLAYIDQQGYYQQSAGRPPTISAYEVYSYRSNLIILDLRSEDEFTIGHIPGAINVSPNSILNEISTSRSTSNKQVVLVCQTGQFSSYINCLLGLYGIENITTLEYGMASWNSKFSEIWEDNCVWIYKDTTYYMNDTIIRNSTASPFPSIPEIEGNSIEEKVKKRIANLLESANTTIGKPTENTVLFTKLNTVYNFLDYPASGFRGFKVVCYGIENLYRLYGRTGPADTPNHPIGSLWYDIPINLNPLTRFHIQTLPNSGPLVIYSSNGLDSAYLMGLLRFLGYDAKSMLFGVNAFGYNRMLNHEDPLIREDAFKPEDIFDLPYVTGSE